MADQLVIMFVGAAADAAWLSSLLELGGLSAHVTRVSGWGALESVTAGWDVVVAGGPVAACTAAAISAVRPWRFNTPVAAVGTDGVSGDGIEWFRPDAAAHLIALLRAIGRAAVCEGHLRRAEARAATLERQLWQAGRLHAVGQMAAGVAHEFNNLLTVISGYGEQLAWRTEGEEELHRLVRPIRQAGKRGAELTQRLLTFSRQDPQTPTRVCLNGAVREAVGMLAPLLGETVSVAVRLADDIPPVNGHAGHLVEIITNLAVNARDAMPGGGTITIETRRTGDHLPDVPGPVELVVRDTGTGMDAETLARACEPFFTTKEPGEGTGLGLSLVTNLLEQCGGSLDMTSQPGHGTEMRVRLAGVRVDPAALQPQIPVDAEPRARGGETVLVVEDDAAVREIVTQFLQGAAYQVLEARDADEAFAVMRRDAPVVDLLVTDVVLPGQSGPELAGRLREHAPKMRTLFISGYPSDAVGGARAPMFLSKPFSRAAFLQAVRKALGAPRHRDIHR